MKDIFHVVKYERWLSFHFFSVFHSNKSNLPIPPRMAIARLSTSTSYDAVVARNFKFLKHACLLRVVFLSCILLNVKDCNLPWGQRSCFVYFLQLKKRIKIRKNKKELFCWVCECCITALVRKINNQSDKKRKKREKERNSHFWFLFSVLLP